jgi:TolB-like protein
MKKAALLFIIPLLLSCASAQRGVENIEGQDVKRAITNHRDELIDVIPAKSRVAVLEMASFDNDFDDFIREELIMILVNAKKYSVVDRDSLDLIRAEHAFQMSGEVNDKTAVSIGKFIGASVVITGVIRKITKDIEISIKVLDVETAEIILLVSMNVLESKKV